VGDVKVLVLELGPVDALAAGPVHVGKVPLQVASERARKTMTVRRRRMRGRRAR
jgi:hypothetical protein